MFFLGMACCESGKPESFHQRCGLDGGRDVCEEPFECYRVRQFEDDPEPVAICTRPCTRTADCPAWYEEEGHCKGDVQAACLLGFCQAWCQ